MLENRSWRSVAALSSKTEMVTAKPDVDIYKQTRELVV
jgi:hypothetical protein